MSVELVVIIIMGILLGISIIAITVVLYNFLLLLSELNKRQVYIISDILGSIDLATPHLDTLNPNVENGVEDILNEAKDEDSGYFNPHEFDVDSFKEENE